MFCEKNYIIFSDVTNYKFSMSYIKSFTLIFQKIIFGLFALHLTAKEEKKAEGKYHLAFWGSMGAGAPLICARSGDSQNQQYMLPT